MGLNKKGLESKVIVIIIFTVLVLLFLVIMSGSMGEWINAIIDRLFGY